MESPIHMKYDMTMTKEEKTKIYGVVSYPINDQI